jgi:hypothetical protein
MDTCLPHSHDVFGQNYALVMAGLAPAIHVFVWLEFKAWMPATSAGMTMPPKLFPL